MSRFSAEDAILLCLEQNPGWRSSAFVMSHTQLDRSHISMVLNRLLRQGRVERREKDFDTSSFFGKPLPKPRTFQRPTAYWRIAS